MNAVAFLFTFPGRWIVGFISFCLIMEIKLFDSKQNTPSISILRKLPFKICPRQVTLLKRQMIKWLIKSYHFTGINVFLRTAEFHGKCLLGGSSIIVNVLNSLKSWGKGGEGVEEGWSQNPHLFFNYCGFH